ncbi:sodium transporter [Sphingobacterium athyrii]|uniref:Sodium transporter n=2 Tax=Sphingobacterium athyrii TaxID=2152717 RepID=A0A363NZQ3_9SPHI|nr:sodium transporter [Sphingobacterium athyrii]
MSVLDYIVMLLFAGIVIVAGLSFGKTGKTMKSYFAAGGAVPWQISGLSLFMSFFSAGTFVVWGSIAYQYGLVAVVIQLTMCIGGVLVGKFIAPAWQKSHALTAAEFVSRRLGISVQKFYSYLILFISMMYTGAFLYPVAKIVNVSTGFPVEFCVIILGLLIILYTVVGGLWGAMITDVIQFIVLTAAVIIVVPLAFDRIGGVRELFIQAPPNYFLPVTPEYSWLFLLAFGIYNGIFIGGNWAYVQRYTSVESPKSARKVGYLFAALYFFSPFIWMLPPMIYKIVNSNLVGLEAEGAYLLMCKEVLPKGLIGLMLGGMVFATASSVNATLNLAAAVFTNDLYKVIRSSSKPKQLMFVAKTAVVVFGLLTIGVALLVPSAGGIVEVVITVGAVTGCSLYGPPIWALFSKYHSGRSILYCTLLGLGINVYLKLLHPIVTGFSFDRAEEMLAGAITPFVLLGGYEIWAKSKKEVSPSYLDYKMKQKEQIGSLSDESEDEEDTEAQNQYGLKVLSKTMALTAGIFVVLALVADKGTWVTLMVGLVIGLASYSIYRNLKK